MLGHPDADALAACREGLPGTRRLARIRAHLARCPRCASLDQELAAVSTLLASAPAPRIPDELAARLDTVLAVESAARARGESHVAADGISAAPDGIPAAPTDVPAAAGEGTGLAGRRPRRPDKGGPRRRQPRSARPVRPVRPWRVAALRAASVTAILLVFAGGGYGVSRLLHGGGGTTSSGAAAPSAPSARGGAAAPGPSGGRAYAPPRAGAIMPAISVRVVHSGTDYQPARLVTQAEAVLAGHPAKSGGHASAASIAITGCVMQFAPGASSILADEALYLGQKATVIIRAPAAGGPGRAWVIVPGCSAAPTSRHLIKAAVLPGSG
jgi:hypothetical protein